MTIGEKITALRASHNMSQGDLAEKLNVSRQSISKWETNTSTPELDKLIQLSDLFHLSIDELVRDDHIPNAPDEADIPTADTAPAPQPQIIVHQSVSTRKIVGFILLGIGLLCCVLALLFDGGMLLIGGYVISCSVVCLLVKGHSALIIGWATFLLFALLAPYYTGIHMLEAFAPVYQDDGITVNKIAAILSWLFLFALVFFTVRAWTKKRK